MRLMAVIKGSETCTTAEVAKIASVGMGAVIDRKAPPKRAQGKFPPDQLSPAPSPLTMRTTHPTAAAATMRPSGVVRTAQLRRQSVLLAALVYRRREGRQVVQQDVGIPGSCGARIPGG